MISDLILGSFLTFRGPYGLFLGLGLGSKTVLGSSHVAEQHMCFMSVLESIHVVEQLLFCRFPSILIFDFDLILGSFLTFWGPNELFLG